MGEIADYYSWGGGAPEPDDLELETNGRIYEGAGLVPTCVNCGSTNIKVSAAGNHYCAELCWVESATTDKIKEEL
jgi:hypothetical protein